MPQKDFVSITTFTEKELTKGEPSGWKTHKGICREIKNRIMPKLVKIDGKETLYVNANDSGAILFKPVNVNSKEYPFLSWNWKISNILPESREKEVGGDDYAAAVCVVYGKNFFSLLFGRYKIIIYAYGNNVCVGERYKSPCEDRARIIIVQSGGKSAGRWLSYKHNHYEDYIREFGEEPPGIVYVGFQTNADRTHDRVETWYSDIVLCP